MQLGGGRGKIQETGSLACFVYGSFIIKIKNLHIVGYTPNPKMGALVFCPLMKQLPILEKGAFGSYAEPSSLRSNR